VETIAPATPHHLSFATGGQTVVAGECSGPVELRSEDAFGNPSPAAADTAVSLSAPPGVVFHAGAGCSGPAVAALTLTAGSSTATFSFRPTSAGSPTVTAAGLGPAATQAETVVAGAPARLVFATPARAITAGGCSGEVRVEARDALGNPATFAAPAAIALAAAPADGLAFFSDEGCTAEIGSAAVAAGAGAATFRFRSTAAGAVTLRASAPGLSPDPTQGATVSPGPPDHLALAGAPESLVAGDCSAPVTVRAVDVHGNPSPLGAGAAVSLSAAPAAGFAFHSAAGCAGAALASVSIAPGETEATVSLRGTAAGAVTATAAAAGLAPDGRTGRTS
jgi:hypothetical protein